MSGRDTISMSETPERLRSTKVDCGRGSCRLLPALLLEMQPLDADAHHLLAAQQIDDHLALIGFL